MEEKQEFFVDPVLYEGSPIETAEMPDNMRSCYRFLNGLGIRFHRVEHAPAMTIAACERVDEILGTEMCKNLFLCNRQKTAYYLLLMPGEKPFRTKDLSAQLGVARLSFADEDAMGELLNLTPGSVTVMGLLFDKEQRVRLLIDEDLLKRQYFGCHPCLNTASLRIATEDLINVILPALDHHYTAVSL